MASRIGQWRAAWVGLALALGLHVSDEALTGFLPVYNGLVESIRANHPWVPLPTFTFPVWLGGLIVGVALLFALTPVVSRGAQWVRVVSIILGLIMTGNALGHLGASLYWGRPAPGLYSSPVLLVAAAALLATAFRAGVRGASTRIGRHINAPRSVVYGALLDARAVAQWKVPDGMTCHVHAFDAREGGSFRIALTYEAAAGTGKTSARTDTYHGRFVKLVPNEQVVEVDEFETEDPALRGEMTITITLVDAGGGTDLHAVHDGLPRGVSAADNETGWRMALAKLAALVEAGHA